MNDLYLKTDTAFEMALALIEAGVWTEDQHPTGIACVDVIGEIEGKPGWHVNLRPQAELDVSLLPVMDPPPANPVRVWF